jgi:hypothetical protein
MSQVEKNITKAKKEVVHYVNNKTFYDEILKHKKKVEEYRQKGLPDPKLSNYIGDCIYRIASKLSNKPCFISYSFRDEMISDGIENCIMYFNDFNPEKYDNPFAYFTQIVYYAFLRRISKEERQRYTIYKNFQENIVNYGKDSLLTDSDNNHLLTAPMYDNINDFMSKYEKKEELKKAKRKIVKEGLDKFYDDESIVKKEVEIKSNARTRNSISGGTSHQVAIE